MKKLMFVLYLAVAVSVTSCDFGRKLNDGDVSRKDVSNLVDSTATELKNAVDATAKTAKEVVENVTQEGVSNLIADLEKLLSSSALNKAALKSNLVTKVEEVKQHLAKLQSMLKSGSNDVLLASKDIQSLISSLRKALLALGSSTVGITPGGSFEAV
jgi:chromosome segregation ATPase